MKSIGKIYRSLALCIYALCGLALLVFAVPATGLKAKAVATGSMRPAISPGSLVIIRNVSWKELKVGDVINYQSLFNRKTTITHRIVKAEKKGQTPFFITKGDANRVSDPEIVGGQIKGKVISHVPYVGNLLLMANKPMIILPIIYIVAIPILIEEVRRLKEYYKLSQPYRALGFSGSHDEDTKTLGKKLAMGASIFTGFIVLGIITGPSVFAMLKTNTVTLANNRLSVAVAQPPVSHCTSNNNINVSNSSNQAASTGNASSSGNTNGGTATSGNASNSNSTNTNVTVTNCH